MAGEDPRGSSWGWGVTPMGLDRGKMRKPWEVWERVLAENKRNG